MSTIIDINSIYDKLKKQIENSPSKRLYYLSMRKKDFTQPIEIAPNPITIAKILAPLIKCQSETIVRCIEQSFTQNQISLIGNNGLIICQKLNAHEHLTTEFINKIQGLQINYFVRSYNEIHNLLSKIISDLRTTKNT